jgi:hypothetical protein
VGENVDRESAPWFSARKSTSRKTHWCREDSKSLIESLDFSVHYTPKYIPELCGCNRTWTLIDGLSRPLAHIGEALHPLILRSDGGSPSGRMHRRPGFAVHSVRSRRGPLSDETLFGATNRRFNDAVDARDYREAVNVSAWTEHARISVCSDWNLADEILAGKRPTRETVASTLRTGALLRGQVDPVVMLYIADLLNGKEAGGRPRGSGASPSKTIQAEYALKARIDELYLKAKCKKKAFEIFAEEQISQGKPHMRTPAAVEKAYQRATAKRRAPDK